MAEAGVQTTASSMQETALPAPPCASWCLCLRFYLLPSQALPRGSPRPQVLQAWGRQAESTQAAIRVLPPNPD